VVDDEEAVRTSLRTVLNTYGFEVKTFASGQEFLAHIAKERPSCVLLDVRMPDLDGFEVQRTLLADRISVPVIFLTGHGDIPMAVNAIRNGAFDFVEKPARDDLLVESIKQAVERSSVHELEVERREAVIERYRRLTARERAVFDLVSEGYSSQAIAGKLEISIRTVDHHRARILEKMEATGVSHLIKMSLDLRV
jgi:FixJ family two-component response regulator